MTTCMSNGWPHNHRCRYSDGFFCEDCRQYFAVGSETYRRYELPSDLYCVVWNIGCRAGRAGEPLPDVQEICEALRLGADGRGIAFEEDDARREAVIVRAEEFVRLHGQDFKSAWVAIG
jgi:hypothetical protein